MRDNGKFQDSLLKVCACAIVCGHTGFPALEPLANKPIIFREKKNSWQWWSLFTSVWEWRWTTTKSNNEDGFFWSCFEGFAVGFAKFKYHSCHSPNVSLFFFPLVFFRWTVCRWRVRPIQMSLLPLKLAGTKPGCWWWTPKQTPSSRGAGSPPPLSTWLVRARFHAHCEALQVVQKGWSKWVHLAALSDMLWTQAFSFRLPKQAAH